MNRTQLEHIIRAAGREKDLAFNQALIRYRCVAKKQLLALIRTLPLDDAMKNIVRRRINADFSAADAPPGA